MFENLSFRIKLTILLCCTITGFILVTLVSLNGLQTQQTTSSRLQTLSNIESNLDSLAFSMMEKHDGMSVINDENYEAYIESINANKESYLSSLQQDIENIKTEQGRNELDRIKASLLSYSDSLINIIEQRHLLGFDRKSGIKNRVQAQGDIVLGEIAFLSLVKREFVRVREAEKIYIFETTADNKAILEETFEGFIKRIQNFGLEEKFGPNIDLYLVEIDKLTQQYQATQAAEAVFLDQKTLFLTNRTSVSDYLKSLTLEAESLANKSFDNASYTLILVSVLVAVFSGLIMLAIGKSVNRTLGEIIRDLVKVKEGDLKVKLAINNKRNDEFDALCGSVNDMSEGLNTVVSGVVTTTTDVNEKVANLHQAVNNIADSNQSINTQTRSLVVATEEISTNISNISDTTDNLSNQSKDTYESAKSGAKTMEEALHNLSKTTEFVNKTGDQLNELGRLSLDIDSVISMINDLAEQTNLLALNAAIEAARAGEAGRGFSVVADEVRALAEKTVDATARITDIVGTIQTSTNSAITTMKTGQENLLAIEASGEKAEKVMREIENLAKTGAESANNMAQSILEVSKTAVLMNDDMDKIAQQLQVDTYSISIISDNTDQIYQLVEHLDKKTSVFVIEQ
ncbi:methyl-accepting chemotaxis protein [Marinomonas sp. MED121]|uniref:methyl-accepting chemotaxis protein n=1 Tax=Marinomonas sp. MED121 TaxID=314277 RepID=UPI000069101D|nr:HAMP domain-containing methyl-accepting chemotaxis protein [Marinomonas sp. MED121]EAQ67193.1 methyl-accepting chemotaxis protein [Marinomonas sp. MED121]